MPSSDLQVTRTMHDRKQFLTLLIVGFVVRLALWLWCAELPIQIEDEQHYNALAVNLVKRHEFSLTAGELTSLRPPLYPAFVAAVYSLFGLEAFAAVRFIQLLLSLATVVVVYALGRLVFSDRVAVWGAGFCCFYPSLLGANNLLLTEVVFTFFLSSFCLSVAWAWQQDSVWRFVIVGLLLGLGALTRSVLWLFPVVLVVYLIAAWRVEWRRRVAATATMVTAFAVTIAPWAVRNTQLQGTLTTVDVMGGRNFMMGNYEYTPLFRAWDAISMDGEKAWYRVLLRKHPQRSGLTQGKLDKLALKAGLDFVQENPGLSAKRAVVKFFCFWQLERELVAGAARGYFGEVSKPALIALTAVIFGSYVSAMYLGLFGMFLAPPTDWRVHAFLVLCMAFVCGIHTLVFGHSRYHLPLMPLLLLYAASAAVNLRNIWHERRSLRFALATASCLVFSAVWAFEIAVVDLNRFLDAMRTT